jgi:hypothetical protein
MPVDLLHWLLETQDKPCCTKPLLHFQAQSLIRLPRVLYSEFSGFELLHSTQVPLLFPAQPERKKPTLQSILQLVMGQLLENPPWSS